MAMTMRPYTGEVDKQQVIDLRRACTTAENIDDYPTVSNLWEQLEDIPPEHIRLWENDDGSLLACALVQLNYANLYFFLLSQAQNRQFEEQLMAWATELMRTTMQEHGKQAMLDTATRENDLARIALLERFGFVRQEEQTLKMARSLREPIPEPQLPEGFTLRQVAGEHEMEEYVALHRDAFGTQNMTVEHRLSIMHNPEYLPDLDLVVMAPDSTMVAFCICNISQERNAQSGRSEGEVAIIGTRPAERNAGLGRAMLLAALHRLKAHGIETAVLTTGRWNTNAQRVFVAAGFHITNRILWYSKEV